MCAADTDTSSRMLCSRCVLQHRSQINSAPSRKLFSKMPCSRSVLQHLEVRSTAHSLGHYSTIMVLPCFMGSGSLNRDGWISMDEFEAKHWCRCGCYSTNMCMCHGMLNSRTLQYIILQFSWSLTICRCFFYIKCLLWSIKKHKRCIKKAKIIYFARSPPQKVDRDKNIKVAGVAVTSCRNGRLAE